MTETALSAETRFLGSGTHKHLSTRASLDLLGGGTEGQIQRLPIFHLFAAPQTCQRRLLRQVPASQQRPRNRANAGWGRRTSANRTAGVLG